MEGIKYGVESSWQHDDKEERYPEYLVVVADGGEEHGTCSCASFSLEARADLENFVKFINDPQF